MVYRLLLEVRREHELEGDYNAIVGRLVQKQREEKNVAEESSSFEELIAPKGSSSAKVSQKVSPK